MNNAAMMRDAREREKAERLAAALRENLRRRKQPPATDTPQGDG